MKLKFTFIAILAMLSSFAVNAANSQQVDVVLPTGVSESTFGANTVTDGTNYYATLQAATEAVAGNADAVLYCKPSANVGSLQHAPVTATLTVYGNGANVTGGSERDFDLGNTDPSSGKDIKADMTLTVKHLNGCGAWGAKATEHTVNLVFENCANMGKVFITGTTGTLNITMTDCAFEGVLPEAVYSNANGAITLNNVAFSNLNKAINLNHKVAGTQTVTINGCSFTNCGNNVAADQIPVRVLSSVEGGKSVLNVSNTTFTGTPEGRADILLDSGLGLTEATVTGTAANLLPKNEDENAVMFNVTANEGYTNVAPTDVKVATLAELQAALADNSNELPIIITAQIVIPAGEEVELDLNGKIVTVVYQKESTTKHIYSLDNYGTLTIKDSKGNGSISARGIFVQDGSKLTVESGSIYGIDSNGGSALYQYGGDIVINGGYIEQKAEGTYNFAINALGGTVTVNNGKIAGNHGAIAATGAEVVIYDGEFECTGTDGMTDNVLYTSGSGSITINGGTFVADNDGPAGGCCVYDANGKATIYGGTFSNSSGGDVWGTTGTTIKGGTFENLTETQHIADGYKLGEDGKVTSSVTYVAKIGEQGYETLAAALEATKAMTGDVTVEILDKVTFNQPLIGNYSSINFVGKAENAEMYLDVQGYTTATGKEVTFTDLKLSKSEGGYVANAGFMNLAFGIYDVKKVTYNNCTFLNGACASSGDVTFNGCTFYRSHDRYGLWAYGAPNVVVDGCTFADIRGIKLWDEGKQNIGALTVKNTDFSAVDGKPAIVLTSGKSVTLAGNTYNAEKGALELDLDGNPNGTPVTSDVAPVCVNDNGACGVLVDGKIYTTVAQAAEVATETSTVVLLHNSNETVEFAAGVNLDKNGFEAAGVTVAQPEAGLAGEGTEANPFLINNVDDLVLFRNSVNAGETKYNTAGVWVALGDDIDLTSIENWEPIGTWDYSFDANFDGKGCKIMNLKMSDNTAANGEADLGFFGITAYNVIKDLVIENVTIESEGQIVAAAIAYPYYTEVSDITVCGDIAIKGGNYTAGVLAYTRLCLKASNLSVAGNEGSCIEGARVVGGVIADIQMNHGLVANYSNFSAEGVAVKGTKMVGGISGIISTQTLNGATVKNVTLSSGDSRVGTIAGAFGGTSTISNVTVENVTGATAIVGPTYDGAKAVEACIGDTYYSTLQAAVDAVEEKGTVTLLADVDASEITTGKNFTIALNGNECDVTLPEGYAALPDLNGNYVIGAKPTATVNNLGMTTVAAGEYSIWDGSYDSNTEDDGDMPLSFVMQFLADQDAEDMATSPFADWYGDFVLTFTGLENGSFTANNCYLAGHYGSFGWVKIPVDGMVIEDGARYPVMLGVGMGQKYDYICSSVEDFKCALYLAPEILEANPNIEVKLELGVVDNSKGSDAAASALINNDNVYSVTEYTYDALDFDPSYIAEFVIDDANSVDYTFTEEKTVGTLTYKRNLIEGIWNPLYLPFQISVEELVENYDIAYYNQMISIDTNNDGAFDDYEMEVAYITTGTLRANYPYFIRPKSPEACALEYVAEGVTLYPAVEKKIVTSSVANIFTLSGTHKAMSEDELDGYLAVSYDGAWRPSTGIKAHRLYFKIEENDNSPFATTAAKSIRIVVRGEGDGTTGVEELETENEEVKAIYDLTGRRVQETVKGGIYIINGKKVLVK